MSEPVRVKITDPRHIFGMGVAAGAMDAVEDLEDLPAHLRGIPGFQLALATLRAKANAARAEFIGKNLVAIAKAGHEVALYKSVSFDPQTAELICEFYGHEDDG